MRVLVLSTYPEPLQRALTQIAGDEVLAYTELIDLGFLNSNAIDFIVSYGFRHIMQKSVLTLTGVDCQSFPVCRGTAAAIRTSGPGLMKSQKVLLGASVDTGDVLVQRPATFAPDETLATSYGQLRSTIEDLFAENRPDLRSQRLKPRPQGAGTWICHRTKNKERYMALLPRGWETTVAELEALGRAIRSPAKAAAPVGPQTR